MSGAWALFKRDLALAWAGGGAAAPLGFFVGATTLVPLAVGTDLVKLADIGPPLIWVTAALAALLTLERLFQADLEDNSLDQLMLSSTPLEALVAAKGAALFCAIGVPLALLGAPMAIALQLPPAAAPVMVAGLALGIAGFIGVGLLGAALSAGVRRGGLLIAVIVLPFFAPFIIFGAAAAQQAADGKGFADAFTLLAGLSLFAVALGPVGAAAALRLHAE